MERKLLSEDRLTPKLIGLINSGWTIYDVSGAIMPEYTTESKNLPLKIIQNEKQGDS